MSSKKRIQTKRIPARKWALAVPTDAAFEQLGDLDFNSTYDHGCSLLRSLGFDQLSDVEGYALEEPYGFRGIPRQFSLWSHRAGVFVKADSYEGRLSSMTLEMEFNCGYFRGNYKRAGIIAGSGGSYVNMDGTSAWERSFNVGGFASVSLLELLREVQSWSRLVPIQDWQRKNKEAMYLPAESYFSFYPDKHDSNLLAEELSAKYNTQIRQAQEDLIQRAPEYIKAVFERHFSQEEKRPGKPLNREDWARAENALNLYGDVLSAANIAWPTLDQSKLLSDWSKLIICPEQDIDLDRMIEQGPGGLSIAHGLLVCMHHEGNKDRLLGIMDKMEQEDLFRLACIPDRSGNTLMSHALSWLGSYRHSAGSKLLGRSLWPESVIEVMSKLVDRLGASNVHLSPPEKPALGALLDLIDDPSRTPDASGLPLRSSLLQFKKQLEVLEAANELGMSYLDASDDVQVQIMKRLRDSVHKWPGLSSLIASWDREVLCSQSSTFSRTVSRPRL